MRIVHQPTGREAQKRTERATGAALYRVYPPAENENHEGKAFETVEEVAIFIIKNPSWKIWVAPGNGHADGQVRNGLIIEGVFDIDNLKARGVLS